MLKSVLVDQRGTALILNITATVMLTGMNGDFHIISLCKLSFFYWLNCVPQTDVGRDSKLKSIDKVFPSKVKYKL